MPSPWILRSYPLGLASSADRPSCRILSGTPITVFALSLLACLPSLVGPSSMAIFISASTDLDLDLVNVLSLELNYFYSRCRNSHILLLRTVNCSAPNFPPPSLCRDAFSALPQTFSSHPPAFPSPPPSKSTRGAAPLTDPPIPIKSLPPSHAH
jgi:hypothetical protein